MSGTKKKKGWGVQVVVLGLQEGERSPEAWSELPALMRKNIEAISQTPEVEWVEVTNGLKKLTTFAPRDSEAVANALQGRCPSLAAILREQKDSKLVQEVRDLLAQS